MTAVVAKSKGQATPISYAHVAIVMLALLMLGVYLLLPFVTQPELGSMTVNTLTAERANNELDLETNGLIFIPLSAAAALLVGVWGLVRPYMVHTASFLAAIAGVMSLLYYAIFFKVYLEDKLTYLNAMGPAFWLLMVLGVLLIAQVFLPRPDVDPRYKPRQFLGNQEGVILLGTVALIFVVGLANSRFVAERNVTDILSGNAYIAVAAIGMSMVIITGNIDISVGSLIGLLAAISGTMVVNGSPVWLSWLVPILVGVLIQGFIGFLVAFARIPSIVVTLGMLSILKGALILWTQGDRITGMPDSFFLAQQRPLGIPMPIWFMIGLTIAAALWLRYSSTGRSFYAQGGNAEAARLSGISQRGVIMRVFLINGVFAGIASILYATQLTVIQATPPPALELTIITASVVGGVSILGGTGTVIGSTLATLLLNFIRSSLIFINVSPYWIRAIQGVLILVTVLADLVRRRRQRL